MSDSDAFEILETAWDQGIRYFDTAPHYGLGLSERRLGEFLRTKPRDEYVLSTKVGKLIVPNPNPTPDDMANAFAVPGDFTREFDQSLDGVRRSIDESLERMGLDRIDITLLHDPDEAPQGTDYATKTGIESLAILKDEGVTANIGIGSKDVTALALAANSGVIDVAMISGRFTLLEQPALAEVLPACQKNGVECVAVSVFNSGLLARNEIPADARYEYADAPTDIIERARDIAAVCREFQVDLPTAALSFVLQHPAVVSRLIAGSRVSQVTESAARAHEAVPQELWDALRERGFIPTF